jgi:hypothetical protein
MGFSLVILPQIHRGAKRKMRLQAKDGCHQKPAVNSMSMVGLRLELVMSPAQNAMSRKAMIGEDACSEIACFAHLTNGVDGLRRIQFPEALTQLCEWDIFGTG